MKKLTKREKRRLRNRKKIALTDRPRLSVFRSNKYIYAQIIEQDTGKILASSSSLQLKLKERGINAATKVGEDIAKKALKAKIKRVVFDRGQYKYHGQVKSLADSARKAGLEF